MTQEETPRKTEWPDLYYTEKSKTNTHTQEYTLIIEELQSQLTDQRRTEIAAEVAARQPSKHPTSNPPGGEG